MLRVIFILLFCWQVNDCFGQYNWVLEKEKNGIRLFQSEVKNSVFKAIRVECTLSGNYTKLIALLTNVPHFKNWIFNTKNSRLIYKFSPLEFIYYSETRMPVPFSNRDIVIYLQIKTDSLPRFLSISGKSYPGLLPDVPGKVRVNNFKANWNVTMPNPNSIHIIYIVEMDPEGNIPGWVANLFLDKGPLETFSNLAKQLKE